MTDLIIRLENSVDTRETENVVREAFWNHYSPGCNDHYMVHLMRKCPAFVPELDFVAERDGKIIGNIMYVQSIIEGDDGKKYNVLSLGPLAVLPEYQRQSVGRQLIEHTLGLARAMGFRAALLYGEPNHYTKRGFIAAERLGIRTSDNLFADAMHAQELYEGALAGITGRYIEDAVYEIDEAAAAEFDKGFPFKEKITGTPSQLRFDEMVAMRRPAG